MKKYRVCLDIGGTKVLGAIFDEKQDIVFRLKKKTKAREGMQNVEDTIVSVVHELLSGYGITMEDVEAIAAGAPGVINQDTGVILFSPNLPWENYEIERILEERFNRPFYIGNDANIGVYGEWKYGAAKGLTQVVGLFIGTGMGGGLILEGKIYSGNDCKGAELGHMILNTEGPRCNCGQRGCLEAFSSKIGMVDYIQQQIMRGRKTVMSEAITDGVFKSKAMKAAYEVGDNVMIEAIDRACYYLAVASGSLVNIFSPQMIVFGGGVMEAMGDEFLARILKNVDAFCLPSIRNSVVFARAALNDDSILYGALALIEEKQKL
jgi:glucokinase